MLIIDLVSASNKLIARQKIKPGHELFQINTSSGEVELPVTMYEGKDSDGNKRRAVLHLKDRQFIVALNKNSALKSFNARRPVILDGKN